MSTIPMRYWLFGYDNYYPHGGMDDVVGAYDNLLEAVSHFDGLLENETYDHVQLWDLTEKRCVKGYTVDYYQNTRKLERHEPLPIMCPNCDHVSYFHNSNVGRFCVNCGWQEVKT